LSSMAQPLEVEQTLRPSISQILQQHGDPADQNLKSQILKSSDSQILQQHGDPAGQIFRSQILKSSNSQILIFSDPAAAW